VTVARAVDKLVLVTTNLGKSAFSGFKCSYCLAKLCPDSALFIGHHKFKHAFAVGSKG